MLPERAATQAVAANVSKAFCDRFIVADSNFSKPFYSFVNRAFCCTGLTFET
jgi:hypothetical protein